MTEAKGQLIDSLATLLVETAHIRDSEWREALSAEFQIETPDAQWANEKRLPHAFARFIKLAITARIDAAIGQLACEAPDIEHALAILRKA